MRSSGCRAALAASLLLCAAAAHAGSPPAIPLPQKGTANGVATLDGSGQVPIGQLGNAGSAAGGMTSTSGGDLTCSVVSQVGTCTLDSVLAPGAVGDATHAATITYNAKGIITSTTASPITSAGIGAIPLPQKGAANGVAPLGADQLVPDVYLPAVATSGVQNVNGHTGSVVTVTLSDVGGLAASLLGIANGVASTDSANYLTDAEFPPLTGDVTKPGGSRVTTLATVNSNVGTCGDATHVCQVTLNAKGLATAAIPVATGAVSTTGDSSNTTVTAPYASAVPRSLAAQSGDVVNAKAIGAKGDTKGISSCTISASSASLNCAGAAFVAGDAGKNFYLQGADASFAPLTGTIASVTDATDVVLSVSATNYTPSYRLFNQHFWAITIASPGSGYVTNDTVTLTCGGAATTSPIITVTASGGAVTDVTVTNNGVFPSTFSGTCTQASTSGSGTGATFTATLYQTGGEFLYGTDDTAAITNAVADAAAVHGVVYLPCGTYWLASQTTAIPLSGVEIDGCGSSAYGWPFSGGTELLISNTSTSAFGGATSGGLRQANGFALKHMTIFYPTQDGSQVSPVSFPPTLEADVFTNGTIEDVRVVNALDFLKVDASSAGSGLGRVNFVDARIYGINSVLWFLNGAADLVTFGPHTLLGINNGDSFGLVGAGNLGKYTWTSGEAIKVDVGGSTKTSVDGLMMKGGFSHGYAKAIHIVSGNVDVSHVDDWYFEGQQVLAIDTTGIASSLDFVGGGTYASDPYDKTLAPAVFSFSGSGTGSQITIRNFDVLNAAGNVVNVTSDMNRLSVMGSTLAHFGQSTTVAAYVAINGSVNVSGQYAFSNNVFVCSGTNDTGAIQWQMVGTGSITSVANNTINSCRFPVVLYGSLGAYSLIGNVSTQTLGSNAVRDNTTGASIVEGSNVWDKLGTIYHLGDMTSVQGSITAHAGGGQGSCTQLVAHSSTVTVVATAANSVCLPPIVQGMDVFVTNTSANAMQVFGVSPNTVDGFTTATGESLNGNGTTRLYHALSSNAWQKTQ